MIYIENRKKKIENIRKKYPGAEIIDLTSRSESEFYKLSPFYPAGNIPIPFSNGEFGESVEGIWQGLKVFETQGVDVSKFKIKDLKNIKRSVRKNGTVLGHQKGLHSVELLDYLTARKKIYIPVYNWVLENRFKELIEILVNKAGSKDLVFLDYNTNEVTDDISKPLSHAALIKKIILERIETYKAPVQGTLDF